MPFIIGTALTTAGMSAATQAAAMAFAVGADVAIASAASAATTAYSAYGAGQQQKANAKTNATIAENQAIREEQEASHEATLMAEQGAAFKARQRTKYAKAGVTGAGTPLLVLEDTANQIQRDVTMKLWGGEQRAGYYRGQSKLSMMRGKSASRAGMLSAGTSLLSGASKTIGSYYGVSRYPKYIRA